MILQNSRNRQSRKYLGYDCGGTAGFLRDNCSVLRVHGSLALCSAVY